MEICERPRYKCYNCSFFHRYYTQKGIQFVQTKFGFCYKKNEVFPIQHFCDGFIFKNRSITVKSMVQDRLNELLTEISTLRNILQEEEHERIERESRGKQL